MTRESQKALLSLILCAAVFATPVAWSGGGTGPVWLRFLAPVVGVGAAVLLLRIHFRKDLIPDFLWKQLATKPFERDGFCFGVALTVVDGVCWIVVPYQSKYERSCRATVTIAPSFGFFLTTRKIEALTLGIDCGPAAAGQACLPLPIRAEYQGSPQRFDVMAEVSYPFGKGRCLRFRNDIPVGTKRENHGAAAQLTGTLLTLGQASPSKAAFVKLHLPTGVAECLSEAYGPSVEELWCLSEPEDVPATLD